MELRWKPFGIKRLRSSLMDGKVISCAEAPYNGKCYYISAGQKRWIISPDTAEKYNINLSDTLQVDKRILAQYPLSSSLYVYPEALEECDNSTQARAFLCKDLNGQGIEFGAGTNPTPVPLDAFVWFADPYEPGEDANAYMDGEFVPVKYPTSLNEMDGIANDSLDFIIACHVIEHTPNPIGAILQCYEKLRKGGTLFMTIPHKSYTFDQNRALTPLSHLIEDYAHPCAERDMLHFLDMCENVDFMRGYRESKTVYANISRMLSGIYRIDLHYHTFTEENFRQMADYINDLLIAKNGEGWRTLDVFEKISFPDANEFYIKAKK